MYHYGGNSVSLFFGLRYVTTRYMLNVLCNDWITWIGWMLLCNNNSQHNLWKKMVPLMNEKCTMLKVVLWWEEYVTLFLVSLWWEECTSLIWFRVRSIIACYILDVICDDKIMWIEWVFCTITPIDTILRKEGTIYFILWKSST